MSGFDLVIGGSGFIGAHLARLLLEAGRRARVYDLNPFPADEPLQPQESVRGDILDYPALRDAMRGADRVFHLAGNPMLWARNPAVFERVNRQGTENVLRAAREVRAGRLVFTSTESILVPRDHRGVVTEDVSPSVEDMLGPYCRSKFLAERAVFLAAADGLDAVVVNPTMPMGPGDRGLTPPGRMLRDFLAGRLKGYMACTLNFVDVRDAALGHMLAAERGRPGRRYILAGHNVALAELFAMAEALSGRPAPRLRVPWAVALGFAYLEELLGRITGRRPMSSVTGVQLCRRSMAFDGARTWRELGGHAPRPLRDSLVEAIVWHLAEMRAGR